MVEMIPYRQADNTRLADESRDARQPSLAFLSFGARRPGTSRPTLGSIVARETLAASIA